MDLRLSISLLGAVLVIAAAGCGGGGASSSNETSSVTKSQFITEAEKICKRASNEQFAALGAALNGHAESASQKELESATVRVVLPRARKMVAELSNLQAPEGQDGDYTELLSQLEDGLDRAEAAPRTFLSGSAFATADEHAEALGLRGCQI